MVKKQILVIEDDAALARVLRDNLTFDGFDVQCVSEGSAALQIVREFTPDLVVLDLMLPGMSGFELCGLLRQRGRTPIIMLTARGERADKLRGLSLGADDYITKPFDLEEFLARVRNVLRRVRPAVERLALGGVTVDFRARTVTGNPLGLHLTEQEFVILQYLAEHRDRIVDRDELLRYVWGYPEAPMTRSVDNAIVRLRKKLEPEPHHPRFIHSVRGEGYRLTTDPIA